MARDVHLCTRMPYPYMLLSYIAIITLSAALLRLARRRARAGLLLGGSACFRALIAIYGWHLLDWLCFGVIVASAARMFFDDRDRRSDVARSIGRLAPDVRGTDPAVRSTHAA